MKKKLEPFSGNLPLQLYNASQIEQLENFWSNKSLIKNKIMNCPIFMIILNILTKKNIYNINKILQM